MCDLCLDEKTAGRRDLLGTGVRLEPDDRKIPRNPSAGKMDNENVDQVFTTCQIDIKQWSPLVCAQKFGTNAHLVQALSSK